MLKDKIALVTGGSRGIGSSICKELAKAGATVLINYANSKDSALKVLEEIVQGNGKGEMVNRGQKKILNIKYTPDFVSDSFIIECKGRANESFPLRWKMFKKSVNDNLKHVILYKPQNQKECDKVIELIIKNKIK